MANYENIRPYSELAHKAAQFGGPKNYLQQHAQAYFSMGVQHEKSTEGWKGAVLVGIAIGAWELCKAGIRYLHDKHLEKAESERLKGEQAAKKLQASIAYIPEKSKNRKDDNHE